MRQLILLALVGLAAQLVDGGLGMAYGVTTTTLLLALGTNPAAASATVHLAEIGTTLASGLSHWKFGNVDWGVVLKVGVPGSVGAFAGATALSNLPVDLARPVTSAILLALGLYILVRFTAVGLRTDRLGQPLRKRFLAPLGLFAGFLDATGGGGWGPVGTPALLSSGRMEPRRVVGSINAAEFLVALSATIGFILALGSQGINPTWVLALLAGGIVAAPIAAWIVRLVPARVLGVAVGGLIILTNARTLMHTDWVGVPESGRSAVYAFVVVVWIIAGTYVIQQQVRGRAATQADAPSSDDHRAATQADAPSSDDHRAAELSQRD